MTEQIREQLSALLDGELPRDEVDLLMRRLGRDPGLRRAFGTYSLIGETLRAPGGRVASAGFAARVTAAVEQGQDRSTGFAQDVPSTGGASFWRRPVVRTALAASAAAVAVLVFRPDPATEQVAAVAVPPAYAPSYAPSYAQASAYADDARYSPTPAQSQRLASYMVAHSQYSTPMVRRNVLTGLIAADPGLRTVSYDMGEAN